MYKGRVMVMRLINLILGMVRKGSAAVDNWRLLMPVEVASQGYGSADFGPQELSTVFMWKCLTERSVQRRVNSHSIAR